MAVLTVRMPDDRHSRLKELAASQGVSVNKMIEELTTVALVEFDTHNRSINNVTLFIRTIRFGQN
jgi:predicted transcriptional regulator